VAWASTVPPPLTPTPEACTEWDVLIFFAEYWHRHHHGRKLMRDGSRLASPGHLRRAVSQLATALRELGVPKHANPANAVSVVKYMGGYKRAVVELGYMESGVVPLDYPGGAGPVHGWPDLADYRGLCGNCRGASRCLHRVVIMGDRRPWF